MNSGDGPDIAADMLKVTRTEWLTREGLALALGVSDKTIKKWVARWVAQGILVEGPGESTGARGRVAGTVSLSRNFGGTA